VDERRALPMRRVIGGRRHTTRATWPFQASMATASETIARKNPARHQARRIFSIQSRSDQEAAALGARLRELRWKNSAWLATAETIAGWNGFEIRKAGSGRSPVRKRSG
jgi:hypothetical protein